MDHCLGVAAELIREMGRNGLPHPPPKGICHAGHARRIGYHPAIPSQKSLTRRLHEAPDTTSCRLLTWPVHDQPVVDVVDDERKEEGELRGGASELSIVCGCGLVRKR